MRDCKEKYCFLALCGQDRETAQDQTYQQVSYHDLPFTLRDERYRCPEALFDPSLIGMNGLGVHQLVFESISRCPAKLQADLYLDITCSGGCTMFGGFSDRLQLEVTRLAPPSAKVMVKASPERKFSTWIGGSILGCLSNESD